MRNASTLHPRGGLGGGAEEEEEEDEAGPGGDMFCVPPCTMRILAMPLRCLCDAGAVRSVVMP